MFSKKTLNHKKKYSVISAPYSDRSTRYKFIVKYFKECLKNSILDVGSSQNYLKNYISNDIQYESIDIVGNPTYKINLEKEALSRFKDDSYYTIICTEVLEHLDNIHEVFDDLCRVSKKYIIISLPNNWLNLKFMLIRGRGALKFYGLPIEKPIDRHKWFFNYEEALKFLSERGKKKNFQVKSHFSTYFGQYNAKYKLLNILFKLYFKNRYGFNNLNYTGVWILLEKQS